MSRPPDTAARGRPEDLAILLREPFRIGSEQLAERFAERVPDPDDGRAKLVRATRRGGEVYAIAREFVTELEARWTARMGEARMRRLRELLVELNEQL